MKTMLLATTAVVALGLGSAVAADLRPITKAPVAMPAPVMSWTGCYVGAGGGYGMSNSEDSTWTPAGTLVGLGATNGGRGWFGTVGAGCDYQFAPSWVIGAFGDVDFSSISGDAFAYTGGGAPLAGEETLDRSWAVGGRLGYVVFPQLLTYVSAGYTQAHFKSTTYLGGATGLPVLFRDSHNNDGWFLGTGYEYNLGWLPGLTWKTEYRFSDYGSSTDPLFTAGGVLSSYVDSHKYVQTVRSELVYRFNFGGSAPVVARY